MGNGVFRHNGFTNTVTTNNHITSRGSDWLFSVSAIMTVSAFGFMAAAFFKTRSQRLFHYLNVAVCLVAAIAYFTMGSNLGWTAIEVEFSRSDAQVAGNMRQIFYVRYIDWFITTPLIVSQLLLVAGLPTPTILYTLVMTEIVVINGLVGSLVHSSYKWGQFCAIWSSKRHKMLTDDLGFFTFGAVAFLFVAFALLWDGRAYARVLGADILRSYNILALWIVIIWTVYPIVWGVSEGGNIIPLDSEVVSYGVLDLLTKRKWPLARRLLKLTDICSQPSLVLLSSGSHATSNSSALGSTSPTPTPTPPDDQPSLASSTPRRTLKLAMAPMASLLQPRLQLLLPLPSPLCKEIRDNASPRSRVL
jgi:bacteriorhodopsin